MTADEPVRAAIYCRMSLAADNDTTKVDDQERLCRATAKRLGWQVADVYQDNNRSAWKHDRKRPQWDRMLADIEAGKISAIIVYHGDRLVRQPMDLEKLIELSRLKGIRLASPTGVRDLSNDEDQFILGIEANMARRESANTSRRRKAQYERWRREGKVRPGGRGGRAFGFATDGVTVLAADRCVLATREVLSEADIVREMAARVLAGERTGAIARDVSARGWRTPTGRPFSHGTIRKMLARPRYAGLMPDGVSTAAWEPVLDRATWEAAAAMLDGRAAGFGYASNARKYLLSGIARCGAPAGDGECGSGLQLRAETRPAQTGYGCVRPGCRKVQRNARLLDAYVISRLVARLAKDDNPAGQVPAAPGLAAEFAALAGQRAEIEAALADHRQGRVTLLMARLDSLDARLEQLRDLAGDDARARLAREHAGITEEEFRGLPLDRQRSLVSAFLDITVLPASRRGPGFRLEDLRVIPR